jgi:hypothetical protein
MLYLVKLVLLQFLIIDLVVLMLVVLPRSLDTITRLVTTIPVAGIKAETNLS